ncbi:bifunctional proline dehydrogenase/L-glutamate gamma-semialdehyde dehydrogenase PutA [Sneathiella sp.]|uniref:bifunctional proline dehydrogenase/L-glutamate gamma-semialdehyde dehydrogenase PutA n=1 Tax=Sneathiella sp. TaxID=1964365 RepID=UPI002610EE27|nr:bifunctional proline dehydrogenase/L-glutamate gamma-semialdehyde dehydrogenase PutA [Sneathiella sp.]MDF2365848.1 bifunctional proline dehydrogenase/L-glutamate gamma-semialdehyde dehydrogenase PutA [Sneathiella sp.]
MAQRKLSHHRSDIRAHYLTNETAAVHKLIDDLDLSEERRNRIVDQAVALVEKLRRADSPGVMETFLGEYGLTTEEGVALMCLAEALLRVPDEITMDALISDKIAPADWSKHLGHSSSPLVNASTWGLMLTGKVVHPLGDGSLDVVGQLRKLVKRVGEPVIRTAVSQSMKVLGHQFVLGRDIQEAMSRARGMEKKGYTYSYDMLGEAARTAEDAQRYFMAYAKAISNISDHSLNSDSRDNPGISVKLSALHPRYEYTQRKRVLDELVPRLSSLVFQAKNANMGFNIDAEEADRLDLSLDIIEAVLTNSDLKGWDGFGVVVQAYGPRAAYVLDWLYALSKRLDRKIMVRLVKGAYWDTEIKLAQVMGYEGYPVFTRKAATDVSYLACAKKLLSMTDHIYPQFATHNAHSIAAVLEMADGEDSFEFQRLHGMGEGLHDLVMAQNKNRCRIYAPVGVHEDLLAYLVRRLLENGANSSFVNQVLDEKVPPQQVVRDPVGAILSYPTIENNKIPSPAALYGASRRNSVGVNFASPSVLSDFDAARDAFKEITWHAAPLIGGKLVAGKGQELRNPSLRSDIVGTVIAATREDVGRAVSIAVVETKNWRNTPVNDRAEILERIADLYEENRVELMALLAREAGKSLMDGISEVREAADFCRYYALRAREEAKKGDKEGRGLFICISPWNFPLAIFTGQIAAALVAGNTVIAKPAEQTPLIAARAVELMRDAGIPGDVLQLLLGDGAVVGAALVSHPDIQGVCFTGSTETAQRIARSMAANADPEAPLIAETGGLNAMIVDSSALPEQAIRDIVASAFQSAGQRCSALRVLYVQEDVAEKVIHMLEGAMAELKIGNPWDISVDVGPVIDADAKSMIEAHCKKLEEAGRLIKKLPLPSQAKSGCYASPAAYRIDGIEELKKEIFGPVLHIATFKAEDVNKVVEKINATGYGLTLGLHTRVDTRVQDVCDRAHVGNLYVNRNQIGAVVGVQPFGGEGLSGTGPKAGGPLYLHRFMRKKGYSAPSPTQVSGKWTDVSASGELQSVIRGLVQAQSRWDQREDRRAVLERASSKLDKSHQEIFRTPLDQAVDYNPAPVDLVGPTGESNRLSLHGRGVILCAGSEAIRMAAMALLTGNGVLLADAPEEAEGLIKAFDGEKELKGLIVRLEEELTPGLVAAAPSLSGISLTAGEYDLRAYRQAIAAREGAIIPLIIGGEDWELYVAERALCIDTTASGGNTKLLAANEA